MALAGELETWRTQTQKGTVYWIESIKSRRGTAAHARRRPVDVGPALREQLFDKVPTVILTSATLSSAISPPSRGKPSTSSNPASA